MGSGKTCGGVEKEEEEEEEEEEDEALKSVIDMAGNNNSCTLVSSYRSSPLLSSTPDVANIASDGLCANVWFHCSMKN